MATRPRGGRPRLLDDQKQRRLLRMLLLEDANVADAARAVGCSVRTVQRTARSDAVFGWRLAMAYRVRDRGRRQRRARLAAEHTTLGGLTSALRQAVGRAWGDKTRTPEAASGWVEKPGGYDAPQGFEEGRQNPAA